MRKTQSWARRSLAGIRTGNLRYVRGDDELLDFLKSRSWLGYVELDDPSNNTR